MLLSLSPNVSRDYRAAADPPDQLQAIVKFHTREERAPAHRPFTCNKPYLDSVSVLRPSSGKAPFIWFCKTHFVQRAFSVKGGEVLQVATRSLEICYRLHHF